MKPTELHQVFVDSQGVAYLRTEILPNRNQRFALNIGSAVEIIEMDAKTFKTRGLVAVDVEVTEVAKKLLLPLSKSVTVSSRASSVLKSIAENKEIIDMETAKKAAHRSAKKGTAPKAKTAKAPKTAKASTGTRAPRIDPNLKFIKVADNPRREGTGAYKTYALYSKSKTVADFRALCEKTGCDYGYLKTDVRLGHVKLG